MKKPLKVISYEDQGFMKITLPSRDPQMQSKAVTQSACALQYFNSTLCFWKCADTHDYITTNKVGRL